MLTSAAAERNKGPILDVLRRVLPPAGTVLEIASGSGQHAVFFAAALPPLRFLPSDRDAESLASIRTYAAAAHLANVADPVLLDVTHEPWPVARADAIVAINMVHISPWEATLALVSGAARRLERGAPLVLYGPYRVGGRHTAPSNEAFDESLRARDPRWGVRDVEAVLEAASRAGLEEAERVAMPANNLTLVLRRV